MTFRIAEEIRAHSKSTGCTPIEGKGGLLVLARDFSPSGRLILATWEEGSVSGGVERRHSALMGCWSGTGGYVWDLDAKKWDLWKVMRSCVRRF